MKINKGVLLEIGKRKALLFQKLKSQLESKNEFQLLKEKEKELLLRAFKDRIGKLEPSLFLSQEEKNSKKINRCKKISELNIESDKILIDLLNFNPANRKNFK